MWGTGPRELTYTRWILPPDEMDVPVTDPLKTTAPADPTAQNTEQPSVRAVAKSRRTALIGALFLMATSAIGPGFITQTATFTAQMEIGRAHV